MIRFLKPSVVGHFDLIRIYDDDYPVQLKSPRVWKKILRNLALIKQLDLILDYNLRALTKGDDEPYISAPILETAGQMGIKVVPGDDSHGITDINASMDQAVKRLSEAGFSTDWPIPRLYGKQGE